MEEEKCFRCDRSREEAKLLDAVYNNELVKVCEECSLIENIPLIRKPSSLQIAESEKPYTVSQRLWRMAHLPEKQEKEIRITLDSLRKKDNKAEFERKSIFAKDRNKPISLVDNYNWVILMERKKRKITRHQLAEAIGENELVLKMIENKEVPDDALRIIGKIEQYFGIKLRKGDDKLLWHQVIKQEAEEKIPEKVEIKKQEKLGVKEKPAVVLKFNPEIAKNITIADLKRMKDEKERTGLIEQAGRKAAELKKEMNVSEIIWRSKQEEKKEEKENKDLLGNDVEFGE